MAQTFRPYFFVSPSDCDLRRDTYYSARRNYSSNLLHIFYLIGYHRDCGDETFGTGHVGDSEFIILNVQESPSNPGAWFLLEGYYSAHYGEITDSGGWYFGSVIEYMNGAPASWVSIGKHANYPSRSSCDAGAFWADSCDDNMFPGDWTMLSGSNIGNSEAGSILTDCTSSRIGLPGTECLWGSAEFRGWSADNVSEPSTPYGSLLADFNF